MQLGDGADFRAHGKAVVPFVACGDLRGYDADQNYPLMVDDPLEASPAAPVEIVGGDVGRLLPSQAQPRTVEYTFREPTQKPTGPAYKAALVATARQNGRKLCLAFEVSSCAPAADGGPQ